MQIFPWFCAIPNSLTHTITCQATAPNLPQQPVLGRPDPDLSYTSSQTFVRHYSLSCSHPGFSHNLAGKSHLIWAPLLRKIITEKISLVFWQLSQQGRKNNSRLGSWRCGNIRTHFLYAYLSLTGQQMQMPTEKRSTDLERRWLACALLVPMEKQTTLLTAAPVH